MKGKNVLLLNMSLPSEKMVARRYHYLREDNKEYRFWGVNQLEPGTKCIIAELAKNGEMLDRIVVMETPQVAERKDIAEKEGKMELYSSEFYRRRIEEFCYGTEDNKKYIKDRKELADCVDQIEASVRETIGEKKWTYEDLGRECNKRKREIDEEYKKLHFADVENIVDIDGYLKSIEESANIDIDTNSIKKYEELLEKYDVKHYMANKNKHSYYIFKDKWLAAVYASRRYKYEKQSVELQNKNEINNKYKDVIRELNNKLRYLEEQKSNKIAEYYKQYAYQYCLENNLFSNDIADINWDILKKYNLNWVEDGGIVEVVSTEDIGAIVSAIKMENSINVEEGECINLYMDMQGGDRNITTETNAIIQLLSEQNITVAGRYAIKFYDQNFSNQIEEVSERYKTYDLLTAMYTFRKYGRGEELVTYFGERDDDKTKALVKVIDKISEAIQLCNVEGFDEAIEEIDELLNDHEQNENTDEQFELVIEDIKQDYKELIDARKKLYGKYISQIRWCLKKGFIQQAITILEAKMPWEYIHSGLKYYCKKNEEEKIETLTIKLVEAYDPKQKDFMNDLNHYVMKQQEYNSIWQYGLNDKVDENYGSYVKLKAFRHNVNHGNGSNIEGVKSIKVKIEEYLDDFKKLTKKINEEDRVLIFDLNEISKDKIIESANVAKIRVKEIKEAIAEYINSGVKTSDNEQLKAFFMEMDEWKEIFGDETCTDNNKIKNYVSKTKYVNALIEAGIKKSQSKNFEQKDYFKKSNGRIPWKTFLNVCKDNEIEKLMQILDENK